MTFRGSYFDSHSSKYHKCELLASINGPRRLRRRQFQPANSCTTITNNTDRCKQTYAALSWINYTTNRLLIEHSSKFLVFFSVYSTSPNDVHGWHTLNRYGIPTISLESRKKISNSKRMPSIPSLHSSTAGERETLYCFCVVELVRLTRLLFGALIDISIWHWAGNISINGKMNAVLIQYNGFSSPVRLQPERSTEIKLRNEQVKIKYAEPMIPVYKVSVELGLFWKSVMFLAHGNRE